jgi:sarcosine oxidase
MAAERPGAAAGVIADLAVVGAGAIGLATALAAAERGARAVVVERERPGAGQSGGPGRVFRHITDSPERVELARRGRLAWRAAEERLGVPLLGSQGALLVGAPAEGAARLAAAGLPHEVLDGAGVRAALPFLGPWPREGLLDAGGGAIDAEAYVAGAAALLGDAVRPGTVRGLRAEGEGIALEGTDVRAARVLVAAGAGAVELAPRLGLELPIRVAVHHRVAFGPVAGAASLPCLLERSDLGGPRCYGVAVAEDAYSIGVGAFDDRTQEEGVAATAAHAAEAFPGLGAGRRGVVRCASTILAGDPENFGLYAAGPPGAALFAGGNLFKFAPLLGALLAEALLEGRVDPALAPPAA